MSVWFWFAANAGHAVVTWRVVQRLLPAGTRDERLFAAVLIGIGTLSTALHTAAVSVGLSLTSGLAGLLIADLVLLLAARRRPPAVDGPQPPAERAVRVADALALAVVAGVLLAWIDIASRSADVTGTDAAHYHVPVAVNLALGTSLFDLPATPHLYPMAGSLLAAWGIVPLATPAIVDAVMILPFVLLWASLAWIFRLATGRSGIAWTTWITLALFSTPLFRASSLVSADLWFAAAFAATSAVLIAAWARRGWQPFDLMLCGLALGLLLGVKTSAAAAAALLLIAYAALEALRALAARRWRMRVPARTLAAIAAGLALTIGAGGVWLIRNWALFGSPIAPTGVSVLGVTLIPGEPFQPTTYLSVFGDLEKDAGYDLADRAGHWIDIWLGAWFLPAAALTLLVPVDLVLARVRRMDAAILRARTLIFLVTAGAGAAMIWMLIGAPWTSLEWTQGFALRYALPVAALIPLLSMLALLPASAPWYTNGRAAAAGLAVLAVAAATMFAAALDPDRAKYVGVPPLTVGWFAVGAAVVLAGDWISRRPAAARVALALLPLALATGWAPVVAARAARERDRALAAESREMWNVARSVAPSSAGRHAYLTVQAAERLAGRQCERRRFFALSRFDEPLTLQSAVYTNQVFYAGRDAALTERAAPLGTCDYILSTPAVLETDKGAALVAALSGDTTPIGTAGPWVILAAER